MSDSVLDRVEDAVAACRAGRQVIIVDDEDRENEGDLVVAAEHATPAAINFMATHGRGLICLAMEGAMLDRLQIPMMVPEGHNTSGFETGFTISVEAASGVSTGISAPDRARTIRTLIDPASTPADIAMPGHVFPLRARAGGVLERRGQTEASVDLARLAGLAPAGVICEVMREDGEMMRLPELLVFAREHALPVISVEQLVRHRLARTVTGDAPTTPPVRPPIRGGDGSGNADGARTESSAPRALPEEGEADGAASTAGGRRTVSAAATVVPIARTRLPTAHGPFDVAVFRDAQGLEHSALIRGEPSLAEDPPLVRLHSECLTGDTFGSLRCDCGEQLQEAMRRVDERGCGIVLYLRQEGRGIGLGNKLRAYALQDDGLDTVEANHALGFPADARHYDVAAAMLAALGVRRVRLLSNNPDKSAALTALGVDVAEREPLVVAAQAHNAAYLRTKSERMGHDLSESDTEPDTAPDTAPGGRTTTDETH